MLLIAVLGIWGIIGYRIITALNPEIPEAISQDFAVNFNPKTNTEVGTFSVQTAHRDPFLGTLTVQRNTNSRNTNRKKINWPPISYLGVIKKQGATKQVFVVNINGQQHLLKLGQRMDSITLIRGNAKAIVMRYKIQQKTFNIVQ